MHGQAIPQSHLHTAKPQTEGTLQESLRFSSLPYPALNLIINLTLTLTLILPRRTRTTCGGGHGARI